MTRQVSIMITITEGLLVVLEVDNALSRLSDVLLQLQVVTAQSRVLLSQSGSLSDTETRASANNFVHVLPHTNTHEHTILRTC